MGGLIAKIQAAKGTDADTLILSEEMREKFNQLTKEEKSDIKPLFASHYRELHPHLFTIPIRINFYQINVLYSFSLISFESHTYTPLTHCDLFVRF